MNRREAILAAVAGLSAAAAGAPTAHAQASVGTNPDSEYIRSLLRLHDGALTNRELAQVLARGAEKAATTWEILGLQFAMLTSGQAPHPLGQ